MAEGKVLIVDDEPSIRRICSLYLKAEGMSVDTLEKAENIDSAALEHKPDVIVLDLNMPGTDGFRATQILKSKQDTKSIPILILSGRQNIDDKRNAMLDCGADDYLTKPFDPKELITRIEVLRKRALEQKQRLSTIEELEEKLEGMQSNINHQLNTRKYFQDTVIDLLNKDYIIPLKMINEMIDSLRFTDSVNAAKYERLLERTRQLETVLSKLNELHDYRKGKIQPHFRYISIGMLLDNLLEQYEKKARRRMISFSYHSPNAEFKVLTDPDRVRRAVTLLLDRAISITKTGKVEFDISVNSSDLQITISDNMPVEGEPNSLDKFYQESEQDL
jgi:DNA-binding response OmpR family regulator